MFSDQFPSCGGINHTRLEIDGAVYEVEWQRNVIRSDDAPRLVVISHITNQRALDLLNTCINGVRKFTPEEHELWVVDNNSPREWLASALEIPWINWAFNRTEPRPPEARNQAGDDKNDLDQTNWGSYANAIGLQIGACLIETTCRYLMTMHMDTMPVKNEWLSYLRSKIDQGTAAAGVRMDHTRTREGVLHVLGYMVDFQVFRRLGLDFFPNLPDFDVGDEVTVRLREAGYDVFACRNSFWDQELVKLIPTESPLRNLQVDRSFDDNDDVIFLHLGRGVRRSTGNHTRGVSLEDWLSVTRDILAKDN